MNKDLAYGVMKAIQHALGGNIAPHTLLQAADEAVRAVSEHAKNRTVTEFYSDIDSEVP